MQKENDIKSIYKLVCLCRPVSVRCSIASHPEPKSSLAADHSTASLVIPFHPVSLHGRPHFRHLITLLLFVYLCPSLGKVRSCKMRYICSWLRLWSTCFFGLCSTPDCLLRLCCTCILLRFCSTCCFFTFCSTCCFLSFCSTCCSLPLCSTSRSLCLFCSASTSLAMSLLFCFPLVLSVLFRGCFLIA